MGDNSKLKEIYTVVLELSEDIDVESIRRMSEPRWDSLAHASIIAAIESEFGVSLDTQDFERITSFESASLLIEEKLK